jgi:coenzyme PQQ precursor peptide PqqA
MPWPAGTGRQVIDWQGNALHIAAGTQTALAVSRQIGIWRNKMKLEWQKPEVVETEVGLEVTSYATAELDPT